MMKLLCTSLALVAVSPVIAQDRPANSQEKAKPPVVVPNVGVQVVIRRIQPQVNWGLLPQGRRRLGGVGGARILNGPFSAEAHFPAYIANQIGAMKTMFKLDSKATRRLTVAAKGVVHRRRQRQTKPTQQVAQLGLVLVRNGVQPSKSSEFRKRLSQSKIWTGTLKRVLTEEQLKQWNKRPPAQNLTKPNVMLGDDVKIRVIRELKPVIIQPRGR